MDESFANQVRAKNSLQFFIVRVSQSCNVNSIPLYGNCIFLDMLRLGILHVEPRDIYMPASTCILPCMYMYLWIKVTSTPYGYADISD